MLLVIHNLPSKTRYSDLKSLIQSKCGITHVILDNLIQEGTGKQVTVGLADEGDAAILVRKLNGLYIDGQQLYVDSLAKKKPSEQPYNSVKNNFQLGNYQNSNNQLPSLMNQGPVPTMVPSPYTNSLMNASAMYSSGCMPVPQNSFMGFSNQVISQKSTPGQFSGPSQEDQFGFGSEISSSAWSNDWGRRDLPSSGKYPRGQSPPREQRSSGDPRPDHERQSDYRMELSSFNATEPFYKSRRTERSENYSSGRYNRNSKTWSSQSDRDFDKLSRPRGEAPRSVQPAFYQERSEYSTTDNWIVRSRYQLKRGHGDFDNNVQPRPKKFATGIPARQEVRFPGSAAPKNIFSAIERQKNENRDQTWRGQAAAEIAKNMLKDLGLTEKYGPAPVMKYIKASLRARINVVLGKRHNVLPDDIVKLYRKKFIKTEDEKFLAAVEKQYKEAGVETSDEAKEAAKNGWYIEPLVPAVNTGRQNAAKPTRAPNAPAQTLPQKSTPVIEKLPKYPQGDKKVYKEQKKQLKKEITDDTVYELSPSLEKALTEELNLLGEVYVNEFNNPVEGEHPVKDEHKTMLFGDILTDIKKFIKLNVSKRLLNINTSLLIRIFGEPRPPKIKALEEFLRDYDVMSLKKSDKKPSSTKTFFIVHCNSFESYDKLLAQHNIEIGGVVCSIKPLNIIGPPKLVKKLTKQKQMQLEQQVSKDSEKDEITSDVAGSAHDELDDIPEEVHEMIQDIIDSEKEPTDEIEDPHVLTEPQDKQGNVKPDQSSENNEVKGVTEKNDKTNDDSSVNDNKNFNNENGDINKVSENDQENESATDSNELTSEANTNNEGAPQTDGNDEVTLQAEDKEDFTDQIQGNIPDADIDDVAEEDLEDY